MVISSINWELPPSRILSHTRQQCKVILNTLKVFPDKPSNIEWLDEQAMHIKDHG